MSTIKGSMKNLRSLVNTDIARSINIQDKLSKKVYEILNIDINQHNIWAIVKQQKLTLVTDHPVMATQLNFQKDMIRDEINRAFLLEIKSAQIKIAPPTAMRKIKKEKRFTISDTAAKSLHGIAEMIDDEELKASLIQLTKKNN